MTINNVVIHYHDILYVGRVFSIIYLLSISVLFLSVSTCFD